MSNIDAASYSTIGVFDTGYRTDSLFNALTSGKPGPEVQWTVDMVSPAEEGVDLNGIVGARPNPPARNSLRKDLFFRDFVT